MDTSNSAHNEYIVTALLMVMALSWSYVRGGTLQLVFVGLMLVVSIITFAWLDYKQGQR